MASFEREKALAEHLLRRLKLFGSYASDPNDGQSETGMDVVVKFDDGRVVGIQVTELDPHLRSGTARAEEKRLSQNDSDSPYFMWGQSDLPTIANSIGAIISRKVEIADRNTFNSVDEVWLLICSGIPERGAAAATFVMTPLLSDADLNNESNDILAKSKYDRCFLMPILSVEGSFYQWEKPSGWHKTIFLDDIGDQPRAKYISDLHRAAMSGDERELDRLVDEECQLVLSELRAAAR